jgi:hypothetical protein
MKHALLVTSSWVLALLLTPWASAYAQAPAWQTAVATSLDPTSKSAVLATAVDGTGNVYVAGSFTGNLTVGTTSLTSAGSSDGFVAKWSPSSGHFVWAQRAGGTGTDLITSLTVQGNSVLLAGNFASATADFGPTILTNGGSGTRDVFVAKLADAGAASTFAWAQRAGGTDDELVTGLAATNGNLFITGTYYSRQAAFGATLLTGPGAGPTLFVAKLTDAGPTGSFTWAQQVGASTAIGTATALAVSGSSVYISGYFSGPTLTWGAVTLTKANGNTFTSDVFVAKLTDAGATSSLGWAQRLGGDASEVSYALAASGANVYVTGIFKGSTTSLGGVTLINADQTGNSSDIFLAKLTDAGASSSVRWAQRAGGSNYDEANAVAVRGSDIYLAGGFYSATADFGSTTLTTTGDYDIFVTKLSDAESTSTFQWAQQAGGLDADLAYGLAVSGSTVYVAGNCLSPARFGAQTIGSTGSGQTGFLASLSQGAMLATLPATSSASRVALFPNPARTRITVRLPGGSSASSATLTLTTGLGQLLQTHRLTQTVTGQDYELALTGLSSGIYLLQVQVGEQRQQYRLAIE